TVPRSTPPRWRSAAVLITSLPHARRGNHHPRAGPPGAGGPAPGAGGLPQGVAAGTPLVVGERGDVRARPAVSPRPATTGGLGKLPPVSRRRCRPWRVA